jgi:hypothetical protein
LHVAGAGQAKLLSSLLAAARAPRAITAAVVLAVVRVAALDGATQSVQANVVRYLPVAHENAVTVQVLIV